MAWCLQRIGNQHEELRSGAFLEHAVRFWECDLCKAAARTLDGAGPEPWTHPKLAPAPEWTVVERIRRTDGAIDARFGCSRCHAVKRAPTEAPPKACSCDVFAEIRQPRSIERTV